MDNDELCKEDLIKLVELITVCLNVHNETGDIRRIFCMLQDLIPFEKAVVFKGRVANEKLTSIEKVINHSYNDDWLKEYQDRGFVEIDPVIIHSWKANQCSFEWKEAFKRATRESSKFLDLASDYGMLNGLAVLLEGQREKSDYHTGISLNINEKVSNHYKIILDYLAPHLRSLLERPDLNQLPGLTKKEEETLHWVKEGKSSWEIGVILKVSERTVKFHLSNIFGKLNVVNRAQAVAKALQMGLIKL